MPDDPNKNALGDTSPSMLEQAQHLARGWWNGLGSDMRDQAGQPQSELLRRFGVSALTLGPMGLASRGGAVQGNDAAMVHRYSQPARPGEFPSHIMDPRVRADTLARTMESVYPQSMHDLRQPDYRSHGMVALPEEVGFWAKQVPANVSDAAAAAGRAPGPTGDPYTDAILMKQWQARRGTEAERPFTVIPGDKP